MFNVLCKHVFGPGEHPDNHTELIRNVKKIESTYEGDNQFIHIEYSSFVFDKDKMCMSEQQRETVLVLPIARYLDVIHMTQELVEKANELCISSKPNIDRPRDKFLKVTIKRFAEPVKGFGDETLNPPADMMSQVEIGLTNDGEHYDKGEFLVYWSRAQA